MTFEGPRGLQNVRISKQQSNLNLPDLGLQTIRSVLFLVSFIDRNPADFYQIPIALYKYKEQWEHNFRDSHRACKVKFFTFKKGD